jgi:predicted chitinase
MKRVGSNAAVLADALSLVMSPWPTSATVAKWNAAQRKAAWDWVGREILNANDHDDVKRTAPPEMLARWMIRHNGGAS